MDLRLPSINTVALCGRLTDDPEFRLMENGTARLSMRIAVNRSYRGRDNEWQEETSFFSVTAWSGLAERLADRLKKGSPVFVQGRLRSYTWKDDNDQNRSMVEIAANVVQNLETQQGGESEQQAQQQQAPPQTSNVPPPPATDDDGLPF